MNDTTSTGTPPTTTFGGTSRVTTQPAATIEPLPTVTPGKMMAPAPIQQPSPIVTGSA